MKKALILALCLSLVLSLAACGSSAPGEDVSSDFARAQEAAAALERLGIAPEARPETLTPEQFQQLAGIFGRSGC